MLNWFSSFVTANAQSFCDAGFAISFCDLIVATFFDIAFHGLLRFRVGFNRSQVASDAIRFRS